MRRFSSIALLGATMLILAMTNIVQAAGDIAGQYYAYGRNTDGSAYEGTAQIAANSDGSFTVNWQVGTAYSGRGNVEGRVFTVDFGANDPVVYVIMEDGDLHGTWGDGLGLDLLTRAPR